MKARHTPLWNALNAVIFIGLNFFLFPIHPAPPMSESVYKDILKRIKEKRESMGYRCDFSLYDTDLINAVLKEKRIAVSNFDAMNKSPVGKKIFQKSREQCWRKIYRELIISRSGFMQYLAPMAKMEYHVVRGEENKDYNLTRVHPSTWIKNSMLATNSREKAVAFYVDHISETGLFIIARDRADDTILAALNVNDMEIPWESYEYKEGKLQRIDYHIATNHWFSLNTDNTVGININYTRFSFSVVKENEIFKIHNIMFATEGGGGEFDKSVLAEDNLLRFTNGYFLIYLENNKITKLERYHGDALLYRNIYKDGKIERYANFSKICKSKKENATLEDVIDIIEPPYYELFRELCCKPCSEYEPLEDVGRK